MMRGILALRTGAWERRYVTQDAPSDSSVGFAAARSSVGDYHKIAVRLQHGVRS